MLRKFKENECTREVTLEKESPLEKLRDNLAKKTVWVLILKEKENKVDN